MAQIDRRSVWLQEYLATWNATEAARRAGYAHPKQMGSRLLSDPGMASEIQSRIAEKTMSADETLVRLAQQARAGYSSYIMTDGSVDLAGMKADGMMHLVKSVKPTKYGLSVEFYDAQTALLNIGRHHKLFTDTFDVKAELDFTENENALESIIGRISGIASRIGTAPAIDGTSANGN